MARVDPFSFWMFVTTAWETVLRSTGPRLVAPNEGVIVRLRVVPSGMGALSCALIVPLPEAFFTRTKYVVVASVTDIEPTPVTAELMIMDAGVPFTESMVDGCAIADLTLESIRPAASSSALAILMKLSDQANQA